MEFETDIYILNLEGLDAVLGIHWLRTSGKIQWDFADLTMQFTLHEKRVTLNGLPAEKALLMDPKHISQTMKKRRRGLLMTLTLMSTSLQEQQPKFNGTDSQGKSLSDLLLKFNHIFQYQTNFHLLDIVIIVSH